MKRTILILISFVFISAAAHAQRGELRRADRALGRGEIPAAKEAIDNASKDATTGEDPETWILKGQIYMQVIMSEDQAVRDLAPDALEVIDQALAKAESLNPNSVQIIRIQQMQLVLSELIFNYGVEAFNENDYLTASRRFLRSYEISEPFGSVDTTTLYNAALAAELGMDYNKAKTIYKQLVDMKYEQPYLFSSLANIAMVEGDTLHALNTVKSGRLVFPEDLNLIFSEANIYIFTGAVENAKNILSYAIQLDPTNPSLYFALGANFDRMAQDTTYLPADRRMYYLEAEKYYMQAIELNAEYFDAIYNLGVLYFNEGIRIFELADLNLRKTQDFRQYEKDEQEFLQIWLKSQPFFEKAISMIDETDPYYETVVMSLVQLYARTNQPEKLQAIQAIYEKFFGDN